MAKVQKLSRKTVEEFRDELKAALSDCKHENSGSIAAQVNNNIQWAWDNWDNYDFREYYEGEEKPERYTPSFRDMWIDNEPFYVELEMINSRPEMEPYKPHFSY